MKRLLVATAIAVAQFPGLSTVCLADPILLGGIGFGSSANRGRVIIINQTTGSGTLLPGAGAGPDAGFNGLTFDAAGNLYGTSIDNPVFADPQTGHPALVQLDPATGTPVFSVPITFAGDPLEVLDLATQPGTDVLYGTSFTSAVPGTSIYTINKTTGEAALVGATGVIGVTLAFAPDGTLYMSSATFTAAGVQTGSFLNIVDPATGAVTGSVVIDPLSSGNLIHVGGLAIRPTDGAIFASAREANVSQRGNIYQLTIPIVTGATATFLGSTGAGEVGDLAFTPIPEPATLLFAAAGLSAIVWRRRSGRNAGIAQSGRISSRSGSKRIRRF
jgi:hypothetical protein